MRPAFRGGVLRRGDRADGCDRVEREDEGVPRPAVGGRDESRGAREQQRGDREPELSETARERDELAAPVQAGAHRREALEPLLVAGHGSGQ
jgi:hypothetical protein